MKLTKTVGLIIVVVILAVVIGVLVSIYSGQAAERNELNERMSRAQTLLPGLVKQRENLEDQLTQAEALLNANQAQFPESVESIEYDDDLFEIADECTVAITRLTSSKPTNKGIEGVTYSISTFGVVVNGNIEDILDFIYAIRTGDGFRLPWSADVKSIKLDCAGSSASINLDIYAYKGK
jgi:hypothetical protein